MVSFVYLSAECLFNEFYGINCRPKLGAKLLDRFFHRRRQVSPPVNSLRHRFLDGSQHALYCHVAIGSSHDAFACTQKITLSYRMGSSAEQSRERRVYFSPRLSVAVTLRSLPQPRNARRRANHYLSCLSS